jgi:hypothetical protein
LGRIEIFLFGANLHNGEGLSEETTKSSLLSGKSTRRTDLSGGSTERGVDLSVNTRNIWY